MTATARRGWRGLRPGSASILPASLLRSQLETLECPTQEENALILTEDDLPGKLVDRIIT